MDGAEGTLYSGEHFRVSFKFTEKYPFDSPGVSCVYVLCAYMREKKGQGKIKVFGLTPPHILACRLSS